MNLTVTVNHKQLLDVLLNVGLIRPVFIWGAGRISPPSSRNLPDIRQAQPEVVGQSRPFPAKGPAFYLE